MSMVPQPSGPARVPDPVALAQGHRWWRAARGLELPAWILGAVTFAMLGFVATLNQVSWVNHLGGDESRVGADVLASLVVLGFAYWVARPRLQLEVGDPIRTRPRLPAAIEELLTQIEELADLLERGEDHRFHADAAALVFVLDHLDSSSREYLEARGADTRTLRSVARGDDDWISDARRRATHQRLRRFAAAARRRECGDPYRARFDDGPNAGAVVEQRGLERARALFVLAIVLTFVAWVVTWVGLLIADLGLDVGGHCLCFYRSRRGEHNDTAIVMALAIVPMFMTLVAAFARGAAQRAWQTSMPAAPRLASRRPRLTKAVVWLALAMISLAPAVVHCVFVVDWVWLSFVDVIILSAFIPSGLLLTGALSDVLIRQAERRRHRRRVARAGERGPLLEELFAHRLELADAAPPSRAQLEQLAAVLAGASELGRLDPHERDRVVAGLEAASERGPALTRRQRAWLLEDVRTCEVRIAGGGRG